MKRILSLLLAGLLALPSSAQHISARGYAGGIAPESVTTEKPSDTFTGNGVTLPVQIHTHSEESVGFGIVLEHAGTPFRNPTIGFTKARGTIASPTVVALDDPLGQMLFYGYDGTDYSHGATIIAQVDGTPGSNDMPTRIEFSVSADGSQTPALTLTISDTANSVLTIEGSMKLFEQALADADVAGYGQVWVKNTVPTELWFTDDTGVDFEIGAVAGGPSGSGTANTIAKWSSSTVLTDSLITDDGVEIVINGANADIDFRVEGVTNPAIFVEADGGFGITKVGFGTITPEFEIDMNLSSLQLGNTDGASIYLTKKASSGAINFKYRGHNDSASNVVYVETIGQIETNTTGVEDGKLDIQIMRDGAATEWMGFSGLNNEITINQDSEPIDFRIEGDLASTIFFTDGALEKAAFGTITVTSSLLTIEGTQSYKEQVSADADTVAYGQVWVKTVTPNELWFTDDAGTDFRLSGFDSGLSNSLLTLEGSISFKEQLTADASTPEYGQVWVKTTSPNELWFTNDAGTDFILGGIGSSDITGSGTANQIPLFTGAQVIGDSIIAEVSSEIGVNTILPSSVFDVRDSSGGISTVSTSETVVVDGTILGRIDFSAPEELSGTDALLPGASIWGEADAIFSAAVNASDLVFATGESEAALEKMRLTSDGNLILSGSLVLTVDAAGLSGIKAVDVDYISGAIGAGEDEEVFFVNIDETASTGGRIVAFEVVSTVEGSAEIDALEVGAGINPIKQISGTFGNADSILNIAVDVLVALSAGGAGNITIFVADNDTITIGNTVIFEEIEFIVDTAASGPGVSPMFEFSTGVGTWDTFGPSDGTDGFRQTGTAIWLATDIPTWALGTGSEFLIRVTRTRNSLSTAPIVDLVQVETGTDFSWSADGDLDVNIITAAGDVTLSTGNLVVTAGNLDAATIGGGTPGTGAFTTITASSTLVVTGTSQLTGDVTFRGGSNAIIVDKATSSNSIQIGAGDSNQFAIIDLSGDTTYSDFGLRIIRGSGGANTDSTIQHQGTGSLVLKSLHAGDIDFVTTNISRLNVSSGGDLTLVSGDFIITAPTTPASASATGTVGTIAWDSSFIYICIATDTWERVAIATW